MKKIITATLIAISCSSATYAQKGTAEEYIRQGIALHDKGDYQAAIDLYKKALQLDNSSPAANYEIASSYFSMKNYDQSLAYIDKVLQSETGLKADAYILKGSALDLQGKSKEAIKVYETALKYYDDNYLLHYNLALTVFDSKGSIEKITSNLQKALQLNPNHASSHLLLGYTMMDQGKRVQSLLALYNFLLLEPKSSRADNALESLLDQLKKGVNRKDEKTINITMSSADAENEFGPAEMMLSLLEASKSLEQNKDKPEQELFLENTESFFSVLGTLKKDHKGFWWDFYVGFFHDLKNSGNTQAFCNYIWLSKNNVKVNRWLEENKSKLEKFSKWYDAYKRTI